MNLREKFRPELGFTDLDNFNAFYEAVVEKLGVENVHALLPASDEELIEKFKKDEHLNNIPLASWDRAAGYTCYGGNCCGYPSSLKGMLEGIGVNVFACSELVCILKTCAKMVVERRCEV